MNIIAKSGQFLLSGYKTCRLMQ